MLLRTGDVRPDAKAVKGVPLQKEECTMGSLFRSPSPALPAPSPAAPPSAQSAAPPAADIDEIERRRRLDAIARRQRGLASTVATSPRGLLLLSDNGLQRKSLLGE
jgi:hypothetical protein